MIATIMSERLTMATILNYPIHNIYRYNGPNRFMVSWWETDSYFNNDIFKLAIFKLLLLHMIHQDNLDQE